MYILIVEDCSITQKAYREWMSVWGFDFDMVSNGLEAVALAKQNNGKYDLCLMDVDMPLMNGIDATKQIRESIGTMPIMALSSNLDYKQQCLDAGMDDFSLKSSPLSDLLEKIRVLKGLNKTTSHHNQLNQ